MLILFAVFFDFFSFRFDGESIRSHTTVGEVDLNSRFSGERVPMVLRLGRDGVLNPISASTASDGTVGNAL